MHITSKSRYAVKVMLDIALHAQNDVVQRRDISRRQMVPLEYLDQILLRLRKAGLVESTRGPHGGYRLSKKENDVSTWDIFAAVEESLYPVTCLNPENTCKQEHVCEAHNAWGSIFKAIQDPLKKMTLAQLKAGAPGLDIPPPTRASREPSASMCSGGGH